MSRGLRSGGGTAPYRNQPVLPVSGADMGIVRHAPRADAQRMSRSPRAESGNCPNVLGQHGGNYPGSYGRARSGLKKLRLMAPCLEQVDDVLLLCPGQRRPFNPIRTGC